MGAGRWRRANTRLTSGYKRLQAFTSVPKKKMEQAHSPADGEGHGQFMKRANGAVADTARRRRDVGQVSGTRRTPD
jgi:hypothetical protein